ncbi:MAG: HAD family hydrolase [Candidatus Nanopelagicales bacterium]
MEKLREVDTLVVDKTGTLTVGRPSVSEIVPADGWAAPDVLQLAASLNRSSEHPLAKAMQHAAAADGVVLSEPEDFAAEPGFGVRRPGRRPQRRGRQRGTHGGERHPGPARRRRADAHPRRS